MLEIGDLVHDQTQRGVICCIEPPIMKALHFHSYVPLSTWTIVEKNYDPNCRISDSVKKRIIDYLNSQPDRKTGE